LGKLFCAISLAIDVQSPYEALGLDPDASDDEIEQAYRRRIKETHPDTGGSVGEFLAVKTAYEQLTDGDAGDVEAGPSTAREKGDATTRTRRRWAWGERREEDTRGTHVRYLNFDVIVDQGWALTDGDLFENAATLDLDPTDYGEFVVDEDQTLLAAAEEAGHAWPYSCRGGACANCAVAVLEGELSTPVNHVLPESMLDREIRLSCVGEPLSDELTVVFNVKHLPELDDLRLPPHPSD
jgi:ferredoxin